jgi:hypothetical protein
MLAPTPDLLSPDLTPIRREVVGYEENVASLPSRWARASALLEDLY